jgi:CelD/BcsL family acetyltransferase involved in cellulose biosynthesis
MTVAPRFVSRLWSAPSPTATAPAPGQPEYTVIVVDSLAHWAELAKDWNDLLGQSRANVVFLTWEWLYAWAECFWTPGAELFILAIFRAGELVGIAPWCIQRRSCGPVTVRQIEFLGVSSAASDYLDVFARRGEEKQVAKCVYDLLFQEARSRWDTLALVDIPADSLFLLHLLNSIAEDGKHVDIQPGVFCPSVPLPATAAEFMVSLSPHRRAQFMRHQRLLERSGKVEHVTTMSRDGLDTSVLDALYGLYPWKSGMEKARFYRFLERFLTRAAGTDWVQIDLLTVDGKPVAGLFHLRSAGTLFQYLLASDKTAYPKVSVGNLLIGLCLQQAIAEHIARYDILRGSEDYKFHWAVGGRRSLNVRIYQRRLRASVLVALSSVTAFLKVLLR